MSLSKEETEVKKNIEWLKEKIEREVNRTFGEDEHVYSRGQHKAYTEVLNLISQLDEPELPMIPEFVAEWYESEGKRSSWWNWFYKWGRDERRSDLEIKTIKWMQDYNEEKFVDMFLHGYTVEEEQKFYVLTKRETLVLLKTSNGIIETNHPLSWTTDETRENYQLTEQEIKDYDERYIPFMVPVNEVNND